MASGRPARVSSCHCSPSVRVTAGSVIENVRLVAEALTRAADAKPPSS
ncbi:hypothetical protein [Microbacterium testaceum]|nr:hypothetical protein [Microbacterium testaceum]